MNDEPKQDPNNPEIKRSEPQEPTATEAGPGDAAQQGANDGGEAEADPFAVLQALQKENAELKDRLMRALAETENTRRRAEKDRSDASKFGGSGIAKELLPVLDNLGRAVSAVPPELSEENEQIKNLVVGVEMTEKQFLDAFNRFGIKRIDPKGEKFSYDRHQAMSEREGTGEAPGTIVEVLQAGYMMHERLLRPAMVVVAKGEPKKTGRPEGHDPIDTTA
ncbi:MAG: nucleotide exchange factor GrpE [Alphaproteobacteria bacterium]